MIGGLGRIWNETVKSYLSLLDLRVEWRLHVSTLKIEAVRTHNKLLEHVSNMMAHAQKSDLVFPRNGRVHLNWRGRQFSRLLAADVCASAVVMVVMLDTQCSEVVWRVLATHSTRMFPLHFPYRASPCAIRFQLSCTTYQTTWCHKPEDRNVKGFTTEKSSHRERVLVAWR